MIFPKTKTTHTHNFQIHTNKILHCVTHNQQQQKEWNPSIIQTKYYIDKQKQLFFFIKTNQQNKNLKKKKQKQNISKTIEV